jgi:hypothetical protein
VGATVAVVVSSPSHDDDDDDDDDDDGRLSSRASPKYDSDASWGWDAARDITADQSSSPYAGGISIRRGGPD